ncbi:J domain-containing protein [Halobacillus salinarum]|uniref:J domain-containing protein n=1 Tax=Halobacillus salinarum TaxID=2932257 RepID=A0ABY4EJL3_9BACI|nr:J domain-containing protein [Halobacillus salinarum]UOQ44263.1 J domain-containing protein [Halobacillus salinarum]
MDLQEAYKTLGVSEKSSDEEIDKQYMIWVKREHANKKNQDNKTKPFDIDKINDAYQVIKSHREPGSNSQKELRSFQGKADHFFHYYKFHTLGAVVLIIVCIIAVQNFLNHRQEQEAMASLPPADLSIMLYGGYFDAEADKDQLSENMLAQFPDWQRVKITLNYLPGGSGDAMNRGRQEKSVAILATERPDVYIMDKNIFEQHVQGGMFKPLEQLESSNKKVQDNKLLHSTTEQNQTDHIYGVVVPDNRLFDGMEINEGEKVAAVRRDAENTANAMELMELLASD